MTMGAAAMQLKTSGGLIKWGGGKVQMPSGAVLKMRYFASYLRWARQRVREDPAYGLMILQRCGLTVEDADTLLASSDPVAKQLVTAPRNQVRCARCRRVLWDPESIARGIGPECRRKGSSRG